ncbi:MAG: hypothetical protein RLZ25_2406 [Pseudomonadota bacterium]|jgi:hypothetical protein
MTKSPTRKPLGRSARNASGSTPESAENPADQVLDESENSERLEKQLALMQIDQETADRIRKLPKDVGWLLITAGLLGMVLPGVIGTPLLVLGSLMVWPSSQKKAGQWLSGQSPKMFRGSMKQINRFLDDLERRYPSER